MLMKGIIKNLSLFAVLATSMGLVAGCGEKEDGNNKVTVVDMVGDSIEIAKNPKKVACVSRTTYDLLVAYGLGGKIDGVYKKVLDNSWTSVFYPQSVNHFSYEYEPNHELLISRGVDLVLSPEKYITDALREHGINAITVSLYGNPTFDNYVTYFSNLVTQIWDDEAIKTKANDWNNKVHKAINDITSELSKHNIPKKKLFYVRGDKDKGIQYTDTKGSFTEYAYRVLGFENMSSTLVNGQEQPSKEAICDFNPDVFVMGGIYQRKHINDIKTTEPFTNLDAVKNNQIYTIPMGLTQMEQLNALTHVFFYDQANKLYPEIFNFDVKSSIKSSVKEYFGTDISDTQIQFMLDGLNPEGGELY